MRERERETDRQRDREKRGRGSDKEMDRFRHILKFASKNLFFNAEKQESMRQGGDQRINRSMN